MIRSISAILGYCPRTNSAPTTQREIVERYPCPDYNVEFYFCTLSVTESAPVINYMYSRTFRIGEIAKYRQQSDSIRLTEFLPKEQLCIILAKEIVRKYLNSETFRRLEHKEELLAKWAEIISKRVNIPDYFIDFIKCFYKKKKQLICTYCKVNSLYKSFYCSYNNKIACRDCYGKNKIDFL